MLERPLPSFAAEPKPARPEPSTPVASSPVADRRPGSDRPGADARRPGVRVRPAVQAWRRRSASPPARAASLPPSAAARLRMWTTVQVKVRVSARNSPSEAASSPAAARRPCSDRLSLAGQRAAAPLPALIRDLLPEQTPAGERLRSGSGVLLVPAARLARRQAGSPARPARAASNPAAVRRPCSDRPAWLALRQPPALRAAERPWR